MLHYSFEKLDAVEGRRILMTQSAARFRSGPDGKSLGTLGRVRPQCGVESMFAEGVVNARRIGKAKLKTIGLAVA